MPRRFAFGLATDVAGANLSLVQKAGSWSLSRGLRELAGAYVDMPCPLRRDLLVSEVGFQAHVQKFSMRTFRRSLAKSRMIKASNRSEERRVGKGWCR